MAEDNLILTVRRHFNLSFSMLDRNPVWSCDGRVIYRESFYEGKVYSYLDHDPKRNSREKS